MKLISNTWIDSKIKLNKRLQKKKKNIKFLLVSASYINYSALKQIFKADRLRSRFCSGHPSDQTFSGAEPFAIIWKGGGLHHEDSPHKSAAAVQYCQVTLNQYPLGVFLAACWKIIAAPTPTGQPHIKMGNIFEAPQWRLRKCETL